MSKKAIALILLLFFGGTTFIVLTILTMNDYVFHRDREQLSISRNGVALVSQEDSEVKMECEIFIEPDGKMIVYDAVGTFEVQLADSVLNERFKRVLGRIAGQLSEKQ